MIQQKSILTHDTWADNLPPFHSTVQANSPELPMSLDLLRYWIIEKIQFAEIYIKVFWKVVQSSW
jgi:hypothetical protein